MERYVINGLDLVDINELAQGIADKSFNCVRLVYSLEQFYKNPVVSSDALTANPSLMGKTSMDIFDETVNALTNAGLMVILNNHISDAMWCCSLTDRNGLWHNHNYSDDQWIQAITNMSGRYANNSLVVGNDLRNEIRNDTLELLWPTWGTGSESVDWRGAAIRGGNSVLKVAPNQLIIVEGLNFANDMAPIKDNPIQLDLPNKLVYSYHYYSW